MNLSPIRLTGAVAVVAVVAMLATSCGGDDNPVGPAGGETAAADTVVVGSANFPENVLLAEMYAQALEAKGVKVEKRLNIGSRETYIPALQDGSIDVIPEYSGVLLQYFAKDATAVESEQVYAELQKALPPGLIVLDKSAAEDKDAVVVTDATAKRYNLKAIPDLAPVAGQFVIGGPPEWRDRPTGIPGLQKVYGLRFKAFKPLDAGGPLTVKALKDGTIQVGNVFTTQPEIPDNNFVVLEDPKHLFAAQNVLPLINEKKATDNVRQALNAVSAELTTENLAQNLRRMTVEKEDASAVAKDFLTQSGLL